MRFKLRCWLLDQMLYLPRFWECGATKHQWYWFKLIWYVNIEFRRFGCSYVVWARKRIRMYALLSHISVPEILLLQLR